jgi:hypothetical protein
MRHPVARALGLFLLPAILACVAAALPVCAEDGSIMPKQQEGKYSTCEIETGQFDLHRKYRSMEGPYCGNGFRIGEALKSQHVDIPQAKIKFVEDGASSMMAPAIVSKEAPSSKFDPEANGRELYWFKGLKVEVLDEDGKVMPTAEFLCHSNLDVYNKYRAKAFPTGEPCQIFRLVTVTQGQTSMFFPQGFGVPVASDEPWYISFQAANRSSDVPRKVRHRCTLYFVKDSDLTSPIKALHWMVPAGVVVVDKGSSDANKAATSCCIPTTLGVHAPNNNASPVETDAMGRKVTGHWAVPVGKTAYERPVAESVGENFADKDRKIHFVWTHIHPCCTSAQLIDCDTRKPIFDVNVKTKTKGGLEIMHIDAISSGKGIDLIGKHHYELLAKYDNTTKEPLDSMLSFGIFFEDEKFARPQWCFADPKNPELFCGVKEQNNQAASTDVKKGNPQ